MFEKAVDIADTKTTRLSELFKIGDMKIKTSLVGADCTGIDFEDEDIAGWHFRAVNLTRADLSRVKNFEEAIFYDSTVFQNTILPKGIILEDLGFVTWKG